MPCYTGFGNLADRRPLWNANFSTSNRSEVLFYSPGDDNWWLGIHDGNQLGWSGAGNTTGFGRGHLTRQLVYVGSFSPGASGRAEVLFYHPGDDNWWLGTHNGNQLIWTDAGNTAGFGHGHLSGQLVYVGSFSPGAGGRAEVLFYNPGDDNWWLGTHHGNQLVWSDAGNTAGFGQGHLSGQLVYVGSFSPGAGGRAEVLFYNPGDDNWWLGTHNGNQLIWTDAGNTAGFGRGHLTTQLVRVGAFSSVRGRAEVLFYHNGDGNWWLGSLQGRQLSWNFSGNTGRPGRERVTIHFKSLLQLTQARRDFLANQYAALEELFAAGGNIAVLLGTTEDLSGNPALAALQTLNVGACRRGTITADQDALFQNRNNVGADDLVVYLVNTLIGGQGNFVGCAAFPAGRPGLAIVQANARWLTAHEVGHVLGLSHVCEFPSPDNPNPAVLCVNGSGQSDNLMWPNIQWTNLPPHVAEPEFRTMLGSGFTVACP
jgi:hypothetical protein